MKRFLLCAVWISFACIQTLPAQKPVNEDIPAIIRKHAMEQSQVADIASWLMDVNGPRLTGSPQLDKATQWVVSRCHEWGLQNIQLDPWDGFGRGWQLEHFELHANSGGSYWPVLGYPKAWSAPVSGTGEVIYLDARTQEDLDNYAGKLQGKFVLIDTIREVKEWYEPLTTRYDAEGLLKLANSGPPTPRPRRDYSRRAGQFNFNNAMWKLLESENPIAVLDRSYKGDLGTVFVSGARSADRGAVRNPGQYVVPQVTLSVEQYNRILRLLDKGISTTLTIDLDAIYTNSDSLEYNVIAEIPGSDLGHEVVMFGAHLDSWHTGTGATDNGVGSAVMMEVARVLMETIRESGIQPKRTLRLALWTGEEQGILGSRNYVNKYFAELAPGTWTPQGIKPAQQTISAYYNLDNGTGKIRGIYTQGNTEVVNIFREWFEVFEKDGASTVSLSNTGGTDHLPFDGIGIPGFQFIQDNMAYSSRTHHSNMDNWDHLVEDDMKQAAMIIATFVWNTAQRDEMLPRKIAEEVR